MTTDTPNAQALNVIAKAIEWLPNGVRGDYAGAAFLKLQAVQHLAEPDQVKAIAGHVRYLWKRDRQARSVPINDDTHGAIDPDDFHELADTIRMMPPIDRSIVSMILAGWTRNEIGQQIRISPRTIARRLRRLGGVL